MLLCKLVFIFVVFVLGPQHVKIIIIIIVNKINPMQFVSYICKNIGPSNINSFTLRTMGGGGGVHSGPYIKLIDAPHCLATCHPCTNNHQQSN